MVLVTELAAFLARRDDDERHLARRKDAALLLESRTAVPLVVELGTRVEAARLEHRLHSTTAGNRRRRVSAVSAHLVGTALNEVESLARFGSTMRISCAMSSRVAYRCELSRRRSRVRVPSLPSFPACTAPTFAARACCQRRILRTSFRVLLLSV
jgi:hypothetical protein